MKITIGHLFYDLLNLYGESGNVIALQKAFQEQDIDVKIKNISICDDNWDLDNIDILYIGAGTEQNQLLALDTLMNHKEEIHQFIINNKLFIATGNSIELFGKFIKDEKSETQTLGEFEYYTQRTSKRIVSECVFSYDKLEDKILGFENHQGETINISEPLFTVEQGFGAEKKSKVEGFKKYNFYGTYLIGPLLVRNPMLLETLCKDVIVNKDSNFKFKPFDFELEKIAHTKFLDKYKKD